MEDARRSKRPLHLVWFDLWNAFGSVPHQLIWFSLQRVGVPNEMISIIMDIYEGSSFLVQTASGLTGEVPQERGVKQGCPFCPLLFNLALEGLLRGIELSAARGYSFSKELKSNPWPMPTIWPLPPLRRRTSMRCWSGWKSLPAGQNSDSMWQSVCVTIHKLSKWPQSDSSHVFPPRRSDNSSHGMGGSLQASGSSDWS